MSHSDIILREWELLEALVSGKYPAKVVLTGHTLSIPDIIAVARFVHLLTVHLILRDLAVNEKL